MRNLTATLRAHLLLVAFVILVPMHLSLAGASEYDGKYTGQIACDSIPGQTTKPLRTDFLLKITDGQAQYEREVFQADSSNRLGVTERGTGTVSPRGELTLTGSAGGPGWEYDATYRGQFAGKNLRLSGTQQWSLPTGTRTRPCTITLSRSE